MSSKITIFIEMWKYFVEISLHLPKFFNQKNSEKIANSSYFSKPENPINPKVNQVLKPDEPEPESMVGKPTRTR